MKVRLLFAILGAAVVAVYGALALLLVGLPSADTSSKASITAKDAYPMALREAHGWQGDAQFVSGTATWRDVTAEQLSQEDATWGFTFFSPGSRQIVIVSVTQEGAHGVESVNVPPTVRSVDVASWQVDSPQVLGLFLDHGGRDFLAQHPGATVSLRLGNQERGERLVWLASGIDGADRSTITLQVDANSGEVISRAT